MVTQNMDALLILRTESGYVTAGGSDELMSRLKEGRPIMDPTAINNPSMTSKIDMSKVMQRVLNKSKAAPSSDVVFPSPSKIRDSGMSFLPGLSNIKSGEYSSGVAPTSKKSQVNVSSSQRASLTSVKLVQDTSPQHMSKDINPALNIQLKKTNKAASARKRLTTTQIT